MSYQLGEIINLKNTRVWLVNVYTASHFNSYVRGEIKNDILQRVFFNGGTGSSWMFKRFNSLEIIATDKSKTIIKTSKL